MKESVFNFKYRRNEAETVVYNTFSKALVVLDNEELKQLENGQLEESLEGALKENGILIEDTDDEIAFLKYYHYKAKFSNKKLYLTIAPTMECNFGCPYCYELRRKGRMSLEVQDGIIRFIEKTIDDGVKAISISWYGGEPLLCFDIVKSLSDRIISLCRKSGVLLRMDMVTNGYLLSEKIIEELDTIGITKVQITLDGLKEHHDASRPLIGGQGTFDTIFKNLSLFDDSPISVLVRMNVDNKNCNDFIELKERISAIGNENIEFYTSPVEDIDKEKHNDVTDFMSSDQFMKFAENACDEDGFGESEFSIMDNRYCFCTSETELCYVVDEKGYFYKCWDEVGRTEWACFNILEPDEKNYMQIAKYLAKDPFEDPKCGKCVFLPICFGGCKFQREHLNKTTCSFSDGMLKKYLENSYF